VTALDEVHALVPHARAVVAEHLNRTECRDFGWLTPYVGRRVVAKLETQQLTGSFKVRGALSALALLPAGSSVVAASAGNHGLAVAWAATRLGLTADIVLPQNASPLKRERILRYGAGVLETGSTVEEAMTQARLITERTGRHYVAPFNSLAIVAGQATAVIELLEAQPALVAVVIPAGGGGLLAGAIVARECLNREVALVACEPENFASLAASVRAGRFVRLGRRPTFADGLATNLEPGSITVTIAAQAPDLKFCTVSEEEIAACCAAVFNRESIVAEGAAAAAVAAALKSAEVGVPEGTVGLLLSGGNSASISRWPGQRWCRARSSRWPGGCGATSAWVSTATGRNSSLGTGRPSSGTGSVPWSPPPPRWRPRSAGRCPLTCVKWCSPVCQITSIMTSRCGSAGPARA
jgi:threonine dehydratase